MGIGQTYIRSIGLVGLAEYIKSHGGDFSALVSECGLSLKDIRNQDSFIPFQKFSNVMELAAKRLNRPQLGIEWATVLPPHYPNIGPAVLLSNFASDIEEWISLCVRYYKYHSNAFSYQLLKNEDEPFSIIRFNMDPFAFPSRQFVEHNLAICCQVSRLLMKLPDVNPIRARFRHSRPDDIKIFERVFRCPIEFDCEHDELHFEKYILNAKVKGNLKFFGSVVNYYVTSRIENMDVYDQSAASLVALAIPSVIGIGKCNLEFVAEGLGIHVKKLQRSLADEGVSFTEILDKVRESMAKRMLIESKAPVANIAKMLDYSSTSAFTLAFKRWTEMTPLKYRSTSPTT